MLVINGAEAVTTFNEMNERLSRLRLSTNSIEREREVLSIIESEPVEVKKAFDMHSESLSKNELAALGLSKKNQGYAALFAAFLILLLILNVGR